ncbi:5'-nucleotidase, lipoprotein e(P4) family [Chitinophaga sancti]|uniref:5'-nucleotidase, lipoprotein e(P4) family n=1 Tax=Chitinophaga sancti TaxID=1004 RepID=A0A1K1RET6_9BACT|nr:5'-nucleotidase, lipoprotein e(P4) family [Chitinophaga sancti]WQD65714.1 5'-nucleotidase, lipoprotein e(P4) family [Chitinophaga sancti]WQG88664.1 5'-nucleotidase, lipoprotein e(P4) family [Chitinophaga sancti]SFW70533.1 5'-nucleotidase, lipoprotein e(P4) family [Chitinophaga sancti]
MFSNRFPLFLACALLFACKAPKPAAQHAALAPYGPAFAALWQQRSAEYKALCFQAYNFARLRLNEDLQRGASKPMAIVTDIDETVLDNSPYNVHVALKGENYSDKTWQEWTSKAIADTVPGALSFLKYAAEKGVHVYYITNRSEAERGVTLQNLQRWNFPDADNEHLIPKTTTSSKEERRLQVAKTHEIILLMGDNLGDFSAIFEKQPADKREAATKQAAAEFGSRFIVLPNPMYGDWLPALFQYNYKQNIDSILQTQLKNY